MRRFLLAIAFAAVAGFLLGTLFPKSAEAYLSKLIFQPPAGTSTADNTCGWHGECETPTAGTALDFNAGSDHRAWLRAYGFRHTSYSSTAAYAYPDEPPYELCKIVRAPIYSAGDFVRRITMRYVHTEDRQFTFATLYGSEYGTLNNRHVSNMVSSDKPGCPFTPYHVHEAHDAGSASISLSSLYPNAPDDLGSIDDVFNIAFWTRSAEW